MARAQATDFLSSMRFNVDVVGVGGVSFLQRPGSTGLPQSGFNNVSIPSINVEAVEYKEGTDIYSRKFPGNPSVDDVTLSRGVVRLDSSFYDWIRVVVEGSGEYRADIDIKQYHRDTSLVRPFPTTGGVPNLTRIDTSTPARIIHCHEAFPTMVKPGADLDATSGEVNVAEMTVAIEYFEVEEGSAP